MKRFVSGYELIESGQTTIKELAAYCDSGELRAYGPAGERVVNVTDCTLSPKTKEECRQTAEESFSSHPAVYDNIACYDNHGELILHPTPEQKIDRIAELFYSEYNVLVYRPKDGTPREDVLIFPFDVDKFIELHEQRRNEHNDIFYNPHDMGYSKEISDHINGKVIELYGDNSYQGRPARTEYFEIFSQYMMGFQFLVEDIERLFSCAIDKEINTSIIGNKEKPKTRPSKNEFEVTQKQAANALGCSVATIRNYDRGIGTPRGYPGRKSWVSFYQFVCSHLGEKKAQELARAMNRAVPAGDMAEYSDDERADVF